MQLTRPAPRALKCANVPIGGVCVRPGAAKGPSPKSASELEAMLAASEATPIADSYAMADGVAMVKERMG
jgi:hypothetical protein